MTLPMKPTDLVFTGPHAPAQFRNVWNPAKGEYVPELVGDWPERTTVSAQFLEAADPRYVQTDRGGDDDPALGLLARIVHFTLPTTSANYRVVSYDASTLIYSVERIEDGTR